MKKYDFLPSRHPPFLQDFCKKAQWRAKKLRERGSNTARPTEKGGWGLPIGSRFGRFRRDFVAISSRFADFLLSIRSNRSRFGRFRRVDSVDFGAISSRFRRDLQTSSCRFAPTPCRHPSQDTKKSPIPQSGNRASAIARCRALNLRLVPLANTRASVRSVLLGLARRSRIVMLTSGRRHIARYT